MEEEEELTISHDDLKLLTGVLCRLPSHPTAVASGVRAAELADGHVEEARALVLDAVFTAVGRGVHGLSEDLETLVSAQELPVQLGCAQRTSHCDVSSFMAAVNPLSSVDHAPLALL